MDKNEARNPLLLLHSTVTCHYKNQNTHDMNDTFLIQYQHDIPDELILELQNNLQEFNIVVEKQSDSEYEYATGSLINDIIVYVSENQTSLIVSGLIVRTTYDLLKFSISELFKGLKKHLNKSGDKKSELKKISVKHRIGDKTIDFELETNLKDELIERVIEQSFELLKGENAKAIIANQDYLSKEYDYKQAKFVFNEQNGLWEPINYGAIRKEYNDLIRNANQNIKD